MNTTKTETAEGKRLRLTIPSAQAQIIEQLAQQQDVSFTAVLYEMIANQVQLATKPVPEASPVGVDFESSKELHELHFKLDQLQAQLQLKQNESELPSRPETQLSKPSLEAISRLIQGHLIKPVNNITAQQTQHYLSELDRWFVLKAEMEMLYSLIAGLVIALVPEADRASWQTHLDNIEQMRESLEAKVPPLPDSFRPAHFIDLPL